MNKETLTRVAKNAHLAFSEEDVERYCVSLGEMINQLNILDEVPKEEAYVVNPVEIADILRDDVSGIFMDPYELLKGMKTYENYVRGPRLL
ncbi:MAG: Asp-tRNA(Asn)/Glu-tRNA(Gln) amidotransferase GatCAB subunit C [Candidatus Methanoplasma sp.]|jgi:aspartyl-tRNA(Asn)/glutamyl-tRNA(Gln) amidotransferase subunit C|nr:Asp-tRNA(Asn)/Glu-tRNA(Gln) amidotransferase GatCAB subunit C [Candidatus Methanoplasma sp.]